MALTIYDARKIKTTLAVDLLDARQVQRLVGDIGAAVDVLWLACERQAKERGITDEDFGRSLAGDAIEDAVSALLEAITDFFPRSQRAAMKALLAKMDEAKSKAAAMVQTHLPKLDEAFDSQLAKAQSDLLAELGRLCGNSPASPA